MKNLSFYFALMVAAVLLSCNQTTDVPSTDVSADLNSRLDTRSFDFDTCFDIDDFGCAELQFAGGEETTFTYAPSGVFYPCEVFYRYDRYRCVKPDGSITYIGLNVQLDLDEMRNNSLCNYWLEKIDLWLSNGDFASVSALMNEWQELAEYDAQNKIIQEFLWELPTNDTDGAANMYFYKTTCYYLDWHYDRDRDYWSFVIKNCDEEICCVQTSYWFRNDKNEPEEIAGLRTVKSTGECNSDKELCYHKCD